MEFKKLTSSLVHLFAYDRRDKTKLALEVCLNLPAEADGKKVNAPTYSELDVKVFDGQGRSISLRPSIPQMSQLEEICGEYSAHYTVTLDGMRPVKVIIKRGGEEQTFAFPNVQKCIAELPKEVEEARKRHNLRNEHPQG
jgi:hypothetical protein